MSQTKEHCESGRHGDDGVNIPAAVIVEYSDSKFGGTERKALCEECQTVISNEHHYEITVIRVLAAQ